MAQCGICELNPGGCKWDGCENPGDGCITCRHRCKNEAFYIGGINICHEHETAFWARRPLMGGWDVVATVDTTKKGHWKRRREKNGGESNNKTDN